MRFIKKYSLIVATLLIVVLFLKMRSNYSERFKDVDSRYVDKSSVNLVKGVSQADLSSVLYSHDYITDMSDANFAAKVIVDNLEDGRTLSTLYDLNKRVWQIPVSVIDSIGSKGYKDKARRSKENIGIDQEFLSYNSGANVGNSFSSVQDSDSVVTHEDVVSGLGTITVYVTEELQNASFFGKKDKPCEGVVVRLSKQLVDTANANEPKRETLAYLKTDNEGKVVFSNLNPDFSYSVLPIREGFEYGVSKGTVGGSLADVGKKECATEYSFYQKEHKIRIFDESTLKQIKEDQTITIRSPKDYKGVMSGYVILVLVAWWSLWLFGKIRKKSLSEPILAILMTLTGFCMLSMFSINNPLTDDLLGVDMAQGVIAGIIVMALVINVDFKKFYQDRSAIIFDFPLVCFKWLFKPYKEKVSKLTAVLADDAKGFFLKSLALLGIVVALPFFLLDLFVALLMCFKVPSLYVCVNKFLDKLPKGFGYLLLALFLTLLLFTPLCSAVGGMKVNLNFGFVKFQPSEISKYLIVFFMASFFSVNASKIVQYSKKGNTKLFGSKLKMLLSIFLGLGVLIAVYLVLGDMGPAIVIATTFIILYSIIKSKVDLEGLSSDNRLRSILTCDIAMLIYGIASFVVFLLVGNMLDCMWVFCLLWFVAWVAFGIFKERQVFETPIFFNIVVAAFIFGGSILGCVGMNDVADRLNERNEMCVNTWGVLPIGEDVADAGVNTQVAEGLWAIASGGAWGQGFGNGTPHFTPAFHTDMILQSVGEQMGFVGVFLVILLLAALLRKTIVLGYRSAHPFTFYLCLGVAIVTAIQFVVIALGSTGLIPLTGVTVPFLSYGKVSMILNLVAFGVILSIDSHAAAQAAPAKASADDLVRQDIGKYNYSISLLSWMYCIFAVIIGCTFYYYQCIVRDSTLIRPAYVNNSMGVPVVEYNPRIEQLTKKMLSGDIYDRNGVLLATSDKSKLEEEAHKDVYNKLNLKYDTKKRQQRYYPFGNNLFFMLGDFNTRLYFSSDAESRFPKGYMAESTHLSLLRGYDDRLKDRNGNPIRVDLTSNEYAPGKYHKADQSYELSGYQVRDYSALLPYLKAGINSNKVKRLNERKSGDIEPKDVQLTIDAQLQTHLQKQIADYVKNMKNELSGYNKLRVSVVVLDAKNGDLLTSAVYPLPNFDTLKNHPEAYDDVNNRDISWKAYTDMDLGLVFPSAPGSTSKVITGMAGYRKEGDAIEKNVYFVYDKEKVFKSEPIENVGMNLAYTKSSNCYFVNLMNDKSLFGDLAYIYATLGVTVNGYKSYTFNYQEPVAEWLKHVTSVEDKCVNAYNDYKKSGKIEVMSNRSGKPVEWSWAWGQNGMDATPLAMARALSVVANNGKMPVTRYTLHDDVKTVEVLPSTKRLKSHLKDTRRLHESSRNFSSREDMGGKTGTPERVSQIIKKTHRTKKGKYKVSLIETKSNDAWYTCFIDNATLTKVTREQEPRKQGKTGSTAMQSSLAIAIRIERLNKGEMSGHATKLMDEVVIGALKKYKYIE